MTFLKPVVEDVVNKYLDCGDRTKGFARIYCENCKKSMLLQSSCKGRWFCPSCHEKKVLLCGEFTTIDDCRLPIPEREHEGDHRFPDAVFRLATMMAVISLASANKSLILSAGKSPPSMINSSHRTVSSASSTTMESFATNSAFERALQAAR